MGKTRKDPKGRVLRTGESYRKYDGMYVYKYTDSFGKKTYIYSKDLGKLRDKEENLKRDLLDGIDLYTRKTATIDSVFDRYILTKTTLRSSTYANYSYMYDHYVRNVLGSRKIADIKFSDLLLFYKYLIDNKGLTIGTLKNIHTILHPTFELAVRDDIIRKNPSKDIMAEINKRWGGTTSVRHSLTLNQQEAFMKCLEKPQYIRWKPIFSVMLGTGCRAGEILGLRWDDIDMDNKVISINHSVSYYLRKRDKYVTKYEVSLPKTNAGVRKIPMLPIVYEAFKEELKFQKDLGIKCVVEIDGMSNFIFCNYRGQIHSRQKLNDVIKRITEDYNATEMVNAERECREPVIIPHFTCHHLRHTFCTRFCEKETNVKVIQAIMGHADISTTMNIYAEVTEETKKEVFENLARNLDIFRTN